MRTQLPRELFIPKGARKVTHKHSQAVAYIYTDSRGRPCARLFYGRQSKPVWSYYFRTEEERARRVERGFAHYADYEQRQAERRAARKAKGRGVEVGDVLKTCWGYEQTNIEWFQITRLIGQSMVEIREIACDASETQWLQGKTVPLVDQFTGEPLRRVARDGAVKIDDVRTAWLEKPIADIGGRKIYAAAHYTAYH